MKILAAISLLFLSSIVLGSSNFDFTVMIKGKKSYREFEESCSYAEKFYQRKIETIENFYNMGPHGFIVGSYISDENCVMSVSFYGKNLELVWIHSKENHSRNKLEECMQEMSYKKELKNSVFVNLSYFITEGSGTSCRVNQLVLQPSL